MTTNRGSGRPSIGLRGSRAPVGAVDVSSLVERGGRAVDEGDVEEASRCLLLAKNHAPDDREVLLLEAIVNVARDDGEAALAALDRALEIHPNDLGVLATKAFLLLDTLGEPMEALPLLEELLAYAKEADASGEEAEDDLAGLCFDVCLKLVDARLGCGDVTGAIEAASEACEIEESSEARAALARALFAAGDVADAQLEIDAALKNDPLDKALHAIAGRIHAAQGDDEQATRAFQKAGRLPPRLSAERFRSVVDDVMKGLPEPLGSYVRRLQLVIELHPDLARLREGGCSPSTPLLLEGPSRLASSGDPFSHRPLAAVMYQRNVELLAEDADDVAAVVAAAFIDGVGSFLALEVDEEA